MGKFKLAFGLHNHQPVGNFDHVFRQAHADAYAPFLDLVERFPGIRFSLHQSGILWNWQQQNNPEYFDLVAKLVGRGQLELLTGGFYEPILTAIPTRDVLGQIDMLTGYLKGYFGVEPRGLWLTERVWEPHLPKVLGEAGIKFLPVDDTHFIFAGREQRELTGPFITEHEGVTVTLLPIQKRLRYLIPFGTVPEVIAQLREQAEENPDGVAVYADDGEKFGVWPNTHQHCYDDHWLEQFFHELERNNDWLEVVPLGDAADLPAVGRVYLPSASYEEMLHWALPAKAFVDYEQFENWLKASHKFEQWGRFVRGSHWRAFLSKYDESNLMHKKMLAVSRKLAEVEKSRSLSNDRTAQIKDKLYAAQCNCPYWHGVFGGLYLPHIRQAVYGNIVEAEALIREALGVTGVQIETLDYDCDGHDEVTVTTDQISAVIHPDHGGTLLDLGLLKHGFNLTDTLTRRREGYHLKLDSAVTSAAADGTTSIHDLVLAKEPGLKEYLVDDQYLKRCFIDHFLAEGTTLESFQRGSFAEVGDFVSRPYSFRIDPAAHAVTLTREGTVTGGHAATQIRLEKRFVFQAELGRIDVTYDITKISGPHCVALFAVENNFNFQAGHADDRFLTVDKLRPEDSFLDATGKHYPAHTIALADTYRGVAVAVGSEQTSEIWHAPLFTVSLSEGGFEKVFQGTSLLHMYRLEINDEPIRLSMVLQAGRAEEILAHAFDRDLAATRL
jgi:4-alpha-glucanotransferase